MAPERQYKPECQRGPPQLAWFRCQGEPALPLVVSGASNTDVTLGSVGVMDPDVALNSNFGLEDTMATGAGH